MKNRLFSVLFLSSCFLLFSLNCHCQDDTYATLASYMQGSFSSVEQAEADTNYFNIELEMVRIWPERSDGVWLYIEQAVATNKGQPYRQRIYHVEDKGEGLFTSSMYKINNGKQWFGAFIEPARFDSLPKDSINIIPGCAISMTQEGDIFKGSTNERDCGNAWGKATYATSEVTIHKNKLVSWDRGWNDAGEHVWGAENGGYEFRKKGIVPFYLNLSDPHLPMVGDHYLPPEIQFEFSSYDLTAAGRDSVKVLFEFLSDHPTLVVEIGHHTNSRGSERMNYSLSTKRAEGVKNHLIKMGMNSARIEAKGYGESELLVPDSIIQECSNEQEREEMHQRNRRTVVKVLGINP